MTRTKDTVRGELTERQRLILTSIVENFIKTASPVGSQFLVSHADLALSSATVRNVMMDLEKMGYITQPHTSAGRMPTNKGYRFYVDSLMRLEVLAAEEKDRIVEGLARVSEDVGTVLEVASHSLAKISNLLGVVLAPRFYQGMFDRMELVQLTSDKVLAVIGIQSGLVKTITIEIDNAMSRELLEETARIINERLHGLSLKEIKETIDSRLQSIDYADRSFIDLVIRSSRSMFDFSSPSDLHIGGTSNIVIQPEFMEHEKLRSIAGLLDDRGIMIHVLNQDDLDDDTSEGIGQKIRITIGEENREDFIQHCSLITTTYKVGSVSGTLGVLGPTRMQYSKIIALVGYMAEALTETLTARRGLLS